MKALIKKAGLGEPTVFLFSDTQIKSTSFLEDINNILNTGEVPNLYEQAEKITLKTFRSSMATQLAKDGKKRKPAKKKEQVESSLVLDSSCGVCLEDLEEKPSPAVLWSPCCGGWFHRYFQLPFFSFSIAARPKRTLFFQDLYREDGYNCWVSLL